MAAWIWNNKVVWLLVWVVFMVAADQGSKIWAQGALTEKRTVNKTVVVDGATQTVQVEKFVPARTIEVIPGVFNFKYAENPAAAFSLTGSMPDWLRRPFLLLVSFAACIFIVIWYFRLKQADALLMTCFALIVAGALGNLIDRVRLAYVIDFLDFYVGHPEAARFLVRNFNTSHWPTFNIADSCIVVGAFGVILRTLKPLKELEAQPHSQAA